MCVQTYSVSNKINDKYKISSYCNEDFNVIWRKKRCLLNLLNLCTYKVDLIVGCRLFYMK